MLDRLLLLHPRRRIQSQDLDLLQVVSLQVQGGIELLGLVRHSAFVEAFVPDSQR
ncbi:hypothetical protein PCANC_26318 [Puccinia coronata f. sp. avenae]|uniref:Uncharacterized protein n=1 Tax=Puccinia coronata f. sp. avenae TaxID=200324 RepID=A0A2N5S1U1_9BASI|nr:hypothetical protein PCANC_26318 [Puccinia coronata f. sp. avenae]